MIPLPFLSKVRAHHLAWATTLVFYVASMVVFFQGNRAGAITLGLYALMTGVCAFLCSPNKQ